MYSQMYFIPLRSLTMIGLLSLWVFGMIELRKWIEYLWTGKEIRTEKAPR